MPPTAEKEAREAKRGVEMENIIKLSTGEYYKPKKGEYPTCPCDECKDHNAAKWGACNAGFGVCAAYMDYEHMKAVYRLTVFE